ncbi:MAG: ParB/RepB/Spo0J family partition protein [Clostridia bacterium]|nr:ParB/RepB/Spo0J family partition protein [Clostridia bacterium]
MAKKMLGLGKGLDSIFLDNDISDDLSESSNKTMLRISMIDPKPGQPRKNFDTEALAQLAESIGAHGVLQPIIVRAISEDRYQIIAGERRWRASKMAGQSEIPAIVIEADELEAAQIALVENLQRENLNPLEEAQAYSELIETYDMTQEQIAQKIGKSRSAIANTLRLLDLPEELSMLIEQGNLTAGHARALLGLPNAESRILLGTKAAEQQWSVRVTEDEVRRYARRLALAAAEEEKEETAAPEVKIDYVAELEKRMMRELGRRVKIANKGQRKSITLYFEDNQDLEALLTRICGKDFNDLA